MIKPWYKMTGLQVIYSIARTGHLSIENIVVKGDYIMGILRKMKSSVQLDNILNIVQILILTFAIELLLSTLVFLLGASISWYFLFISFGISIIICEMINSNHVSCYDILMAMAIVVIFSWISGEFFDGTVDGNLYHKLAVGLLKNHWNPFQQMPSLSLTEGAGVESSNSVLWVETYCKVTWIFGASVYAITGNIETGKSYTMIAMTCLFMLVFYYMMKMGNDVRKAIIMACVASFSPIAIQQMFSYYVDGFMHVMLMLLVLSLLMLRYRKIFEVKTSISLVVASMIICGNIKFTGLLYGGIFCIAYYLLDCLTYIKTDKEWKQKVLNESFWYFILAIVTVVWGGSTSYITNFIRHGSLTYPLTGEGKVDIMTGNSPFTEENHFKNLFLSMFSRVDNFTIATGKSTELKIPFTFNKDEVSMLVIPDARISGFGVIFGGLLIAAILVISVWLIFSGRNDKRIIIIMNFAVCIALMFGIKESWWARYSPYIYMLLPIAMYLAIENNKKYVKICSLIFFVLIMFNNCLPLKYIGDSYKYNRTIEAEFLNLKNNGVVEICNEGLHGVYYNFKDYNIYYYINNELADEDDVNVLNYVGTLYRIP